jgi:hypothetical protein
MDISKYTDAKELKEMKDLVFKNEPKSHKQPLFKKNKKYEKYSDSK